MFKKNQKTTKNSQESTSHNPHFSNKKPEAYIICMSCKQPLWSMSLNVVQGTIASSYTAPVGKNKQYMNDKDPLCPLCNNPFGEPPKNRGDKPRFLLRSVATGKSFTV